LNSDKIKERKKKGGGRKKDIQESLSDFFLSISQEKGALSTQKRRKTKKRGGEGGKRGRKL